MRYNEAMTDSDITNTTEGPQLTRWVDALPPRGGGARRDHKFDAVIEEIRQYGPTDQYAEIDVQAQDNNQASTKAGALKKLYPDVEFATRGDKVFARIPAQVNDTVTAA